MEARRLLADTYTQLGYQAESGPWRNFYLTGARDLLKSDVPYTSQLINDGVLAQMDMGMLRDSVEWRKGRRQRGSHQYRLHRYERQSCAYIE